MNPVVAAHRDGSRNPRRAATVFDVIAALTIVVGVLVALSAGASDGGPATIITGVAAILAGLLIHTVAIAMRWLAAMYELASQAASAENAKPVVTHRRAV